MRKFILFKDKSKLKVDSFYIFKFETFKDTKLLNVYVDSRTYHYLDIYSYFCIMKNTRCKGNELCDFGRYYWPNSYTGSSYYDGLKAYRLMDYDEVLAFRKELYTFGRPSPFHPNGKNP